MYRLYGRKDGIWEKIEVIEREEAINSKIDENIEKYEEVIVIREDMSYVVGKVREERKVLRKR